MNADRKPKIAPLLALLIFLTISLAGYGQLRFAYGRGYPPTNVSDATTPDWYLDTIAHRAYLVHCLDSGRVTWTEPLSTKDPILSMEECNEVAVFRTQFDLIFVPKDPIRWRFSGFFCGDSMLIAWSKNLFIVFVHGHERNMGYSVEDPECWNTEVDLPDTLGGTSALCVAGVPPHLRVNRCGYLHTWGMIDRNGTWLIPPIYDAPFRFQNGVAAVVYYGQKRKINEKGEVVDP